jgi:hypothetical protein
VSLFPSPPLPEGEEVKRKEERLKLLEEIKRGQKMESEKVEAHKASDEVDEEEKEEDNFFVNA